MNTPTPPIYPQYRGTSGGLKCLALAGRCYCCPLPRRPEDVAVWRHFCQTVVWRIEEMRRGA